MLVFKLILITRIHCHSNSCILTCLPQHRLSHLKPLLSKNFMPPSNHNKPPRNRHQHAITPNQHHSISASTPPHHHTRRATATPLAGSYEWQDWQRNTSAKRNTTAAASRSKRTTDQGTRRAGGRLVAGGLAARTTMGPSLHHPLFLPQIDVSKPRRMRTETNRRNLHYVLLRTD